MIEQQLKEWEDELRALPKLVLESEPSFIKYSGRWPGSRDCNYEYLNALINFDFIARDTLFEETGEIDTKRAKHRSLEHIYRVFISYFPKVSLFEVCKDLYKLWKDNKVRTLLCPNIEKRTFFAYIDERHYNGQEPIQNGPIIEKVSFKSIIDYIDEQESNKGAQQAQQSQHTEKQVTEVTSEISSTPW